MLAAGRGERFTAGTKQLAELAGQPLVAYAVTAARDAGVDRVVVVVGHDGDAVAAAARLADPAVEIVDCPDPDAGQASSLAAGIAAAAADERARVVVVLLADQPGIGAEAVRAVAAAVRDGADAARARYVDGSGHPVAFSREVFPRLTEVHGDIGARHLLDDLAVAHVLVGGCVPPDVDTVADLERWRRRLAGQDPHADPGAAAGQGPAGQDPHTELDGDPVPSGVTDRGQATRRR